MRSVELDGATVIECGLCGEQFGARRAVVGKTLAEEAAEHGVDRQVWPLAKVLAALPGVSLAGASAGAVDSAPFVDLVITGPEALVQLENLAKAVRLAAGSLRNSWRLEVRFDHSLVLRLSPDSAGSSLRDQQIDLETLAEQIGRGMRLSWWRHANLPENG